MAFTREAAIKAASDGMDELNTVLVRLNDPRRLSDGEARYLLQRVRAVREFGPLMTRIRSFVSQFVEEDR